jgi:O-antigen/teichoic acid export membrane protein
VADPLAWVGALLLRLRRNPLTQRMIRNSSYLFSANTLSAALSMAQSILAARALGVEAFGVLGAITQFSSVLNRLTSFRMGELVVSYLGEFESRGERRKSAALFKAAGIAEVASSAVAFGLLLLLAPLGARLMAKDPAAQGLFVLYGLTILGNLIAESASGLLQTFDRFRRIALITVAQSMATLALIAGAVLTGGGLREVVIAYLAGKLLWAGLMALAALREARRQWGPGWWRAPLSLIIPRRRELLRFAFSTNISGTVNLVTRDSDMLWISALSNPAQVGYYKVAKAFMNVLLVPITPLISTTYREVAREVAARQWDNVRYLLRSGSLISSAWTLPAALGLAIFGPWLVLLYGPDFAPAYDVILALLLGVMAVNIFYWTRSVLLPMGLPDYPTKVSVALAAAQIAGMVLLVPRYGALAMAALLGGYFFLSAVILVWKTRSEIRRAEAEPLPAAGG